MVYTVAERVSTMETPSLTGELYGVNADGTHKQLMLGYRQKREWVYADVVHPLWAEGGKMLIAKYHWNGSHDGVYPMAEYMDVDDGTLTDIGTAPIRNATFIADHKGQVRFATADATDQKRRVYYRASNDAAWELAFDESKGDPVVRPLGFARDDKTAYLACAGAHGAGGLCRLECRSAQDRGRSGAATKPASRSSSGIRPQGFLRAAPRCRAASQRR